MALCTQLDVEQRLQIDITAEPDPVITGLIADAQSLIETAVGRPLESAARTETLDGPWSPILFASFWPITAVTSVTEDGTVLVEDTDFVWYPDGRIVRVSSGGYAMSWRTGKRQSIDLAYTGGYAAGPELGFLGSLCTEVVARAFRRGADTSATPAGSSGPVQSVSLEGSDTVTYATNATTGFFASNPGQYIFLTDLEQAQLRRFSRQVG